MKNLVTLFVFLFAFSLGTANAQCPGTGTGSVVFSQSTPCPAGQQGAIVLLWLCTYDGGGSLTTAQFLAATPSCFLPIQLSSFEGDVSSKSIELSWETQSESNSAFFAVERSYDGINFREIGEVTAAGESETELTYTFTDEDVRDNATSSNVTYRLRQVDYNGEYEYSPIIGFKIDNMFTSFDLLTAAATPQAMTVSFFQGVESEVSAVVLDMQGKVVHLSTITSNVGTNQATLEMENSLSSGIYVISLVSGDKKVTQKVLIP